MHIHHIHTVFHVVLLYMVHKYIDTHIIGDLDYNKILFIFTTMKEEYYILVLKVVRVITKNDLQLPGF